MEAYFECCGYETKESVRESYRYWFRKKTRLAVAVFVALSFLCLVANLFNPNSRVLCLMLAYAGLTVWYCMQPRYYAAKNYKKKLKQFDGNIPPTQVWFKEEIIYQDGIVQITIPYAKVKKIDVTKNLVCIWDEMGNGIDFQADSLVKGNVPELMRFLAERCPQLKLPCW